VGGLECLLRLGKVLRSGLNYVGSVPPLLLPVLLTIVLALGVGASALSVLPREPRPPLEHLESNNTFTSPPPSMSDMDVPLRGQSETVLEQKTSSDGLIQLMPRKRNAGDGLENGSCKGSALFASMTATTHPVGEIDEGELSRPGTSSGSPPTSAPSRTQTPASVTEIRATMPQEQELQLGSPSRGIHEIKASTRAPRPTHVDLPPPPPPQSFSAPQKTPSPSANRGPQIDVPPGLQVLVVDDDKMTRMLFQRMLGRLKCQVTTAVNGYEALQLITGDQNVSQTPTEEHEQPFLDDEDHIPVAEVERENEEKEKEFAIVFLDNQMPVMSGVEMVRKLRKLGRKDLVVGVTGEVFRPPMSTPNG
jgi:CheY-like chemotaxis protein